MLTFDPEWLRINDETDTDGERIVPLFARMVRAQGGMVVGRVVKSNTEMFIAQKWRLGRFTDIGESSTFDDAFKTLETAT
jgi:hypothetical protein